MPPDHMQATEINNLLEQSLLFQSSTMPTATKLYPNLKHSLLSNAAIEVSILLRTYLSKLGVNAKVICGLFKGPRGNAFPQVFLDIDGHIIDNSYTHLEEGFTAEKNMELFVGRFAQKKQIANYRRESPSASKLPIIGKEFLGEKFKQEDVDYLELVCKTELNQQKHIAMHISQAEHDPGVLLYNLLMRKYLNSVIGDGDGDAVAAAVDDELAGV